MCRKLVLGILLALGLSGLASGQVPGVEPPANNTPAATAPAVTPDPLGRGTPSGMVQGFLDAAAAQNYELAAQYLNINKDENYLGPRRARQLQRVLDRGGYVYSRLGLSSDADGDQSDGQPDQDVFGSVRTESGTVNLIAEHVAAPNGKGKIWLVSARTVGELEVMSNTVVASLLDETLPRSLRRTRLAGAPVGHWLAIIVLAFVSYGVAWLITALANFILLRTRIARLAGERFQRALTASLLPIRVVLTTWILWTATILTGVSIVARQYLGRGLEIFGWIALAWIAWRVVDALTEYAIERMTYRGRISMLSAIAFARRSIKIAIVTLATIAALDALGFNVTTGLAALGIGGIAIALGAQKTMENFVGSLTLIADQPVRVGDVCKFGDTTGTVEDIGMRSTRIRTAGRTVVSVPNGQFASIQIENYTRRDKFWINPVLELRYETTSRQIRTIIEGIHDILIKNPDIYDDPARVRLVAFTPSSLRIEVFAYAKVMDHDSFLKTQEAIFLGILEIVENAGASFASPLPPLPSPPDFAARDEGGDAPPQSEKSALTQVPAQDRVRTS
jgi:MscS family membrane protein